MKSLNDLLSSLIIEWLNNLLRFRKVNLKRKLVGIFNKF